MICKNCGLAGDLIAAVRPWSKDEVMMVKQDYEDEPIAVLTLSTVRSVASVFHGTCRGRSHCDCDHIIDMEGKRVNVTPSRNGLH